MMQQVSTANNATTQLTGIDIQFDYTKHKHIWHSIT